MSLVINITIIVILIAVIIDDIRNFRIANLAVVLLFCLCLLALLVEADWRAAAIHAAFAGFAFGLLLLAFHRGLLGGGDTKLLTVAFLNVGPETALTFSLCLLILTLVYWAGAALSLFPALRVGNRLKVPFGPSIGGAWIATHLIDLVASNA